MASRKYEQVRKYYKTVNLSGGNSHSDYWYKKIELPEEKCEKVEQTWNKVEDSKPLAFSLVEVKDTNGKVQCAWWTGGIWEYGRRRGDKVIEWRKLRGGSDIW